MSKYRPENFGKNLHKLMRERGVTSIELAINSGLTPAAISQIINSQRIPSLGSVCKILDVFPVKFERLVKNGRGSR